MEILSFLAAPFIASLILSGIHAYLAFTWSSAASSSSTCRWPRSPRSALGCDHLRRRSAHATAYWVSLGFTFLGAFVFANVRGKHSRIPQEAIIGICYAVASAATILAMSKATGETEHLKDMLVGNLLFVSWHDVWKTALLYGAVGLFHYRFRKNFLAISMNHDMERVNGMSVRFWDLLFYGSFGFVVTSSVAIAGVLLVFCYLIVPSVAGMLFAKTIGKRLAIAWSMGTLVSALGIFLSVKLDLPTGATIVCTFGIVLAVLGCVKAVFHRHTEVAAFEVKTA